MSWIRQRMFETDFGAGFFANDQRTLSFSGPRMTDGEFEEVQSFLVETLRILATQTEPQKWHGETT